VSEPEDRTTGNSVAPWWMYAIFMPLAGALAVAAAVAAISWGWAIAIWAGALGLVVVAAWAYYLLGGWR
jgi:hypothetical protein